MISHAQLYISDIYWISFGLLQAKVYILMFYREIVITVNDLMECNYREQLSSTGNAQIYADEFVQNLVCPIRRILLYQLDIKFGAKLTERKHRK